MRCFLILVAVPLACAFGCDPQAGPEPAPSGAPSSTASAPVAVSSAAPGPSGSASASGASSAASLAGTWEGAYESKKGTVGLPKGVKDKTQTKDDGKAAIGAGTVTLTVDAKGEVKGKSKGALGDASLTGTVEGTTLRAAFMPDDPARNAAMTGVLVGLLKDGVIKGELRVAGPDAVVVRDAPVELKRK